MHKVITKSIFKDYLTCPKNAWLKLHKPELNHLFELTAAEKHLIEQGKNVEMLAQKKFPNGIVMENFDAQCHLNTSSKALFQTTFAFDGFAIRTDILDYDNETKKWNLYEVKNISKIKKDNEAELIADATFQAFVLKENKVNLGKVFILHLNKEYILGDDLDIENLFEEIDKTKEIEDVSNNNLMLMQKAKNELLQDVTEIQCDCIYKGRNSHCKTFNYSHPNIPSYSVHDINRINKKKLRFFIDEGIHTLDDIPSNNELSERQVEQVNAYKKKSPSVKHADIKKILDAFEYPLYFFDYETYSSPIPIFKGFSPYKKIPVQFSLHMVNDEHTEPQHFEYLHELSNDPSKTIIQKLKEFIGSKGTILVWHEEFEKIVNRELGERHPEFKELMENINNRICDLKDMFAQQLYVDANFKGSDSIKKVLPVLIPNLSYKNLGIQEGQEASQKWFDMVHGNTSISEKQKIANDLRKYCGLDTYAMYEIWKHLTLICQPSEYKSKIDTMTKE